MKLPIRIVIADDHALFREGLKAILAYGCDFSVVGEAADTAETVKAVEAAQPHVLLLDLKMPDGNVLQVLHQIRKKSPDTRVLVLSAFVSDEMLLKLASAEVSGYALKGVAIDGLFEAIRTVHEGGVWVDGAIDSEIAQSQFPANRERAD